MEIVDTPSKPKSEPEYEYKFETEIENEKVMLLADKIDIAPIAYAHWVNIIIRDKRYGYAPEIDKWSYHKTGTPPEPYMSKIADWAKSQFDNLLPEQIPEGKIKTIYHHNGKKGLSFKGEIANKTISAYLKHGDINCKLTCYHHYADIEWYCNIEKWEFIFPKGNYTWSPPKNYKHLEKAIIYWLKNEYLKAKA